MSDALPLPLRPELERYEQLARELQRACGSGQPGALLEWAARLSPNLAGLQVWKAFQPGREREGHCALADAQLFVAEAHGFADWGAFAGHLEGLGRENSPLSQFERAADAIADGDAPALRHLLTANPDLVRARSTREHRSTLLHYVSANGIEDFRQRTPANIVEIAKMLLEAGADVNAESDAYGGRSTALGLTATSCHPENAGVQIPLMVLLIEHGAILEVPDRRGAVNDCLHNGRRQAAEFFANHGAHLDLEAACGVGRLDLVKSFLHEDGSLRPGATHKQLIDGFTWACEFGRSAVVGYLLQAGVHASEKLSRGATGLHWAAYGGHGEIVQLLLENGAPVDAIDETYQGKPLDWALHGWEHRTEEASYYETVARLARAGARLNPEWFADSEDPKRLASRVRSDARMMAALRGKIPSQSGRKPQD